MKETKSLAIEIPNVLNQQMKVEKAIRNIGTLQDLAVLLLSDYFEMVKSKKYNHKEKIAEAPPCWLKIKGTPIPEPQKESITT